VLMEAMEQQEILDNFNFHYNMDPIIKQQITQELTDFLRRPPTENEIMNAQTDPIIMGKIKFLKNYQLFQTKLTS